MLNTRMLRPLTRREWLLVGLILLGFLAFGVLFEQRSAFLRRRMGDVGVYLRAGWSIRTGGQSLYTLTDDNGWHYHYPPLFAVLLAPLADPPTRDLVRTVGTSVGVATSPAAGPLHAVSTLAACPVPLEPDLPWTVPFPIAAGIFYLLNLGCMFLGVHLLASSLERVSRLPGVASVSPRQFRWWFLRLMPILLCLPPIGHTLVRGQANLVLLLAISAAIAALVERRSWRAGLWLAGAVCLKLFPAYLLVVPVLRRDLRCLWGCAVGLVIGLLVVPALAIGPQATMRCYVEQLEVLVRPALHLGGNDSARAKELLEVTATDNQAYQALIHNARYLNRQDRPNVAAAWVRLLHWLIGAAFTALTLLVFARRGCREVPATGIWRSLFHLGSVPPLLEPLVLGSLTLIMIQVSPVCHLHYFTLAVPVVMGLLAVALERNRIDAATWRMTGLFAVFVVANVLPLLPGLELLRDVGLASYATLGLWAAACTTLLRGSREELPAVQVVEGRAA